MDTAKATRTTTGSMSKYSARPPATPPIILSELERVRRRGWEGEVVEVMDEGCRPARLRAIGDHPDRPRGPTPRPARRPCRARARAKRRARNPGPASRLDRVADRPRIA